MVKVVTVVPAGTYRVDAETLRKIRTQTPRGEYH